MHRFYPAAFDVGRIQFRQALVFVDGPDVVAVRKRSKGRYQMARATVDPLTASWSPDRKRFRAKQADIGGQVSVRSQKSCGCGKSVNPLKDVMTVAELEELVE